MTWLSLKRPSRIVFRVGDPDGVWHVTRDGVLSSDYPTRGDAVRAACLAAREIEALGGSAQVLSSPGDTILAHHEPQFDAPDAGRPPVAGPPAR